MPYDWFSLSCSIVDTRLDTENIGGHNARTCTLTRPVSLVVTEDPPDVSGPSTCLVPSAVG